LKSAHQAEVELGYHHHGYGYTSRYSWDHPHDDDKFNGTADFHNQEGYFDKGFSGDRNGANPNAVYNTYGGLYDGYGYGSGNHDNHDKRWWAHLEKDNYNGMSYVKNDSSNGLL
jgi:hypothetical protein